MILSRHTPIIVALAMFMEYIDSTVIMTALPTLANDFNVETTALKLAVNAYFIGMGIFLPITGWLSDHWGPVKIFRVAIITFIVGSLLCSVCESLPSFIAARFVQGVAGAMLVPIGRIIVFQSTPKSGYIKAINLLTMSALLGPLIGPAIGGYIITYYHWHWIFLINLPIGLLLLLATVLFGKLKRHPLSPPDWKGMMYSSPGLLLVAAGFSLLDGKILDSKAAFALLATGLLCFYLYWQHYCRQHQNGFNALLDLSLLKVSTFRIGALGGGLFRIGVAGGWFLMPMMLQEGLGLSAAEAGYLTCATAAGAMLMKSLSLKILETVGYRRVLIANALITVMAMYALVLPTPDTPVVILSAILLLYGFFSSLHFTSLGSITYADINDEKVAGATSLISSIYLLATTIGIATAAMVLQASQSLHQMSITDGHIFEPAMCVMSLFMLLSLWFSFTLNKNAGSNLLTS